MKRLLVVLAFAFMVFAVARVVSEETLTQKCRWQTCGQMGGEPVNCDEHREGTARDLTAVVAGTNAGAVVWECGE